MIRALALALLPRQTGIAHTACPAPVTGPSIGVDAMGGGETNMIDANHFVVDHLLE